MTHLTKACLLLCGLAVAGVATAAGTTSQGKKPLSAQERKAMTDKILGNSRNFRQPQTEAQALSTQVRRPDGSELIQVPTSLWSHLSVHRDADGSLRMVEHDGDTTPATLVEGLDHE